MIFCVMFPCRASLPTHTSTLFAPLAHFSLTSSSAVVDACTWGAGGLSSLSLAAGVLQISAFSQFLPLSLSHQASFCIPISRSLILSACLPASVFLICTSPHSSTSPYACFVPPSPHPHPLFLFLFIPLLLPVVILLFSVKPAGCFRPNLAMQIEFV